MKKLDLLTHKLSKHFSLPPSRQKTLSSMILGLLSSRNVHQQSLSQYVESPTPKVSFRKVTGCVIKNFVFHSEFACYPSLLPFRHSLLCSGLEILCFPLENIRIS